MSRPWPPLESKMQSMTVMGLLFWFPIPCELLPVLSWGVQRRKTLPPMNPPLFAALA